MEKEINCFGGIHILTSPQLTTTTIVEEKRSFRERWIEPLLHPVTLPFEPYVKTKFVAKTVPSRDCIAFGDTIIVHPAFLTEFTRALEAQLGKVNHGKI